MADRKRGERKTPSARSSARIVAGSLAGILCLVLGLVAIDESGLGGSERTFPFSETNLVQVASQERILDAKYSHWAFEHTVAVFAWHSRSTKIIFWVSILVSIVGIGFSFWQFIEAGHADKAAAGADQVELKTKLVTLAFKSRSLATFMMLVSLAYLMLYIVMVYPVQEAGTSRRPPGTRTTSTHSIEQTSESEAPSLPQLHETQPPLK